MSELLFSDFPGGLAEWTSSCKGCG